MFHHFDSGDIKYLIAVAVLTVLFVGFVLILPHDRDYEND